MTHRVWAGRNTSGLRAVESGQAPAVAHIVDADADVQQLLSRSLAAAGIEARAYADMGAFLNAQSAEMPGCVIIDAQTLAMGPLATRYPIIVTAHQADVAMAVRVMKKGAIDFVEKPLREREILAAVGAAIEVDRQQRRIASHHAALLVQFATLTRREREVMALVTAGKLNKQVGAHLGVSEITIKAHRGALMRKMGARSLADLVRMADALGEDLPVPPRNGNSIPTRNAAVADRHIGYSLALG